MRKSSGSEKHSIFPIQIRKPKILQNNYLEQDNVGVVAKQTFNDKSFDRRGMDSTISTLINFKA